MPLVIEDQGHFFTGLQTVTGPAGTSVYGTHVEYQVPVEPRDNLVLVHGGGWTSGDRTQVGLYFAKPATPGTPAAPAKGTADAV